MWSILSWWLEFLWKILVYISIWLGFKVDGITCIACIDNCKDCDPDITKCTECFSTYYLWSTEDKCETFCPTTYYPNQTNKLCTLCSSSISECLECSSETQCTRCSASFWLQSDKLSCKSDCSTDIGSFIYFIRHINKRINRNLRTRNKPFE